MPWIRVAMLLASLIQWRTNLQIIFKDTHSRLDRMQQTNKPKKQWNEAWDKTRALALLTLTDSERRSLVIKHWVLCEFVPRRADSRCFPALCLNLKWKSDIFCLSPFAFANEALREDWTPCVYGRWGPKGFTLKGPLWGVTSIYKIWLITVSLSLFEVIAQR